MKAWPFIPLYPALKERIVYLTRPDMVMQKTNCRVSRNVERGNASGKHTGRQSLPSTIDLRHPFHHWNRLINHSVALRSIYFCISARFSELRVCLWKLGKSLDPVFRADKTNVELYKTPCLEVMQRKHRRFIKQKAMNQRLFERQGQSPDIPP